MLYLFLRGKRYALSPPAPLPLYYTATTSLTSKSGAYMPTTCHGISDSRAKLSQSML